MPLPLPLPLGGADVFHLVHDRDMARRGLGSNQCVLVVELEGRLDEGLLGRRLARAEALLPHFSLRLESPLLRPPQWVFGSGRRGERLRVVETDLPVETALSSFFSERRLSGERPLEVVLLRQPSRDVILLFWYHPFTDAKGAMRLLRFLGAPEGPMLAVPSGELFRNRPEALEAMARAERLSLAKAYNEHILQFARRPIVSLAGASSSPRLGTMCFSRLLLSREETAALDKSIRSRAKLAESSVMISAFARVFDRALRQRGLAPAQHLVPVPLSLDPKGACERMFGNHLTMMMFSLDRDDLLREPRAIASLAEQQREIVRRRLDLGMAAAMELISVLPSRLYLGLATLPFGGELSSFIFSNPGNAALDRFLDRSVTDAYAVPSVVPRPGLELIVNRHGGRLSFLVGSFDGLLANEERAGMMAELRAELFGEPLTKTS